MSETKWTPGPWTYEVHELSEGYSGTVYDANGISVGIDYLSSEDAALIAAAPELYAALLGLQSFCDDPDGSEKSETLAMGLARLLPAARAALAKARGEPR